ncbi:thiamine phosphate synthase [Angustibacter sp. McL0619]|uniref:thiamine phosphate synthase n=1 Tax=Angustibacter sp. McL0619 TaxID=3415676 RepID=UPI003CF8F073
MTRTREQRLQRLAEATLYLCTDARSEPGDLAEFAEAVLEAGVDVIQLREKGLEAADEIAALEVLARACHRHDALLAANDRADLARAVGADLLHLGQRDLTPALARAVVGPDVLIGRSTHEPAQAAAAQDDPEVDYLCAGPIWATPTKPGRRAVGLEYVAQVAWAAPTKPWFAIGGIDLERLPQVMSAGAQRIVVVRAIAAADDPGAATRMLRTALKPPVPHGLG